MIACLWVWGDTPTFCVAVCSEGRSFFRFDVERFFCFNHTTQKTPRERAGALSRASLSLSAHTPTLPPTQWTASAPAPPRAAAPPPSAPRLRRPAPPPRPARPPPPAMKRKTPTCTMPTSATTTWTRAPAVKRWRSTSRSVRPVATGCARRRRRWMRPMMTLVRGRREREGGGGGVCVCVCVWGGGGARRLMASVFQSRAAFFWRARAQHTCSRAHRHRACPVVACMERACSVGGLERGAGEGLPQFAFLDPPSTHPPHSVFQQVEVDYYTAAPDPRVQPTSLPEVPILRLFGVTAAGHSVAAFVHGFAPYFYIEAPPGAGPDECDAVGRALNVSVGVCVWVWFGEGRVCFLPHSPSSLPPISPASPTATPAPASPTLSPACPWRRASRSCTTNRVDRAPF